MAMKFNLAIAIVAVILCTTAAVTPATILNHGIKAQQPSQLPAKPENTSSSIVPNLPTQTVQDHHFIVTTVQKNPKTEEPPAIVVIPPSNATGNENGTIIAPGENSTKPTHPIVIDNDTVIIAPPDRNITEVPIAPGENITVIGPEHPIVHPPANNNCSCPPPAPVHVTPAPGQNVTTSEPPHVSQLPSVIPPTEGGSNNNNEGGLHPSQLPVFPTSNNNQSNSNGGNTSNGNQSSSGEQPRVNPLIPSMNGSK